MREGKAKSREKKRERCLSMLTELISGQRSSGHANTYAKKTTVMIVVNSVLLCLLILAMKRQQLQPRTLMSETQTPIKKGCCTLYETIRGHA